MAESTGVSFVIPCFNEAGAIEKTIRELREILVKARFAFEIMVMDDGSTDGTYPAEKVSELLAYIPKNDMVTGIRTGDVRAVPLLRRPAKWFLNRFASYLVKKKIRDVNSGLRVFRKEVVTRSWNIFPDGFSFTTTITMLCALENLRVHTVPINYLKRKGRSKIHPLKDTYNFFLLLMRITMLFNPLRIFMPVALTTFFLCLASIVRDIVLLNLTDTTVLLFLFSVIFLMIGLLADLINKRIR